MHKSINKHLEELKNKHTETNNRINEIQNTQLGINSRISEAEERISDLEDKMVGITSEEENEAKRMKRTEDSLRDLLDNIKRANIQSTVVPEEKEKKKEYEKTFEKSIVENFPNMKKEIDNKVQEPQRVPYSINPRRNTPRHMIIKLTKTKRKERLLKAAREKQQVTYKGNPIHLTADLSAETLQARREWQDIFKVLKGKNRQPRLLYPARITFKID
ncbi:LINE-1 type transposase domain-containing protein 1 [Odocoileus virginianus]|uniref:LINE-1 type transposase domain-containing protein 1 n=1 Tax=Odocoileus virginianus TaxID=9874 RepID=A0ABM4HQZ8_ODOVR